MFAIYYTYGGNTTVIIMLKEVGFKYKRGNERNNNGNC